MVTKVEQAVSGWPLTKRWWTVESRWNWRGMRLCAGGITDCEGGGLCQRYGWTGRRTARVAHKRAGRRLRLQSDLERFPTLLRPLRSQRAPVEGAGGDTKRRIHLAPTRLQQPAARCPLAHCLPAGLETCNAVLCCGRWCCLITIDAIGRSSWDGLLQAWGPGSAACLHACCLGVRQAGRVDRPGGLAV